MPVIARSPEGQVISLWGTALIRGADGKLRVLKVGDIVRQGDQILTTQEGIVQIANGDVQAPVQAADAKAPADDEIDRVISELNAGDRLAAPAAGLSGGGDGSLEAGLRVDRISEGVGGFQIPSGTGDDTVRRVDTVGGTPTPPEDQGVRTPGLDAPSSTISAAEEGAPTNLGLSAPAGNGSIRVDQVPAIGEIRTADGTRVAAGTVLTPAELPGLVYVPPSEYDGSVPAGNFGYTLTVDGQTVSGGTVINLSPVNDAPLATPAAASGNEDGALPLSLGGSDVDGSIVGVTVTRLPAGGTLFLADGLTPVAVGQTLTPAQAATLLYRPGADFNGDQTLLFTVTDNGGATSAPAAVSLTVVAVNDAPVPTIGSGGSGNEDTPIAVSLGGTDVDGTVTTVTITRLPGNGTLFLADGVTPVAASTTLTPAQAASLVFVPAANFNGNVTVGFTVTDNEGAVSPPFNAVVTVVPVNDGPVALADSATLAEDSVATGNVLGNDSDIDGPSLAVSYFVFGGTTHPAGSTAIVGGVGTLTMTAGGSWTFTPAPNFNGAVPAIQVTISDGSLSSTSTLTLTVTPVNDAPVASSTAITVAEESADTPLGLTAPTDADGNALTITVTGLPAVGTITLADGTPVSNGQVLTAAQLAGLQFDAPADLPASTSTSFTYSVSDGSVTVNAGTTISVTPVNDAPVASSSTITVAEESANTPLGLTAPTDVDGNPLTITVTGLPAVGTITLADGTPVTNGQVLSAAQLAGLQFDSPADLPASTSTSFTYSVSDGSVTVSAGTTINLTPVNDAPVAIGDSASATEDAALTIAAASLLANDSDIDGDTLSIVSVQGAVNGTVALVGGNVVFTPAAGYNGPAAFSYTVSDGRGGSSIATVNLTVNPENDAPVAVADIVGAVNEDTALTLTPATLLGNDSDADGDGLSITSVQGAVNGTVALVGGNVVFTPAANYNGPASFTYTISDGNGGSSTATVNLSVNPVNDAPVANADFLTTAEDTPVTITLPSLLANDTDVDGDALVVFAAGSVNQGTLSLVAGNLVFTPAANYSGPASFTYSITDGRGAVSSGTVNINVTPVNDVPAASSSTITVAEESASTPLGLSAPTDIDGDALTITVTGLPTVGTVTLANGTPVNNGQMLTAAQLVGLQFDAPADLLTASSSSFSYSVSDGTSTVSAGTTINVNLVNDAPVANADFLTTAEDTPVTITLPSLLANDTDVDGDTLVVFAAGSVNQGTLSLVAGNLVFTPAANYSGPASFTYSITDGRGAVSSGTVNINVTPVNDVPAASSSTITVTEESASTPLGLSVPADADGDTLTITVTGLPSVGTVTLADGTPVSNGQVLTAAQLAGLRFDAPADLLTATSTGFSYSVSDGTATVNAGTTINVTPVNDAPVAADDLASTAINTTLASIPVLSNDDDGDGDTLTVTAATLANPALGTVSINPDGTLAFTPANNVSGAVLINYTIGDGNGGSSSATLTVNVGANTPPQGTDLTVSVAEDGSRSFSAADFGFSDADAGQSQAAVRIDALPAAGSLLLNGNPVAAGTLVSAAQLAAGALVFVPAADANGSAYASFGFSVQDNAGAFDTTSNTITIDVSPVNDTPVASSSTITVAEESANTPLGLSAPTDVDGNATTITVTGLPSVGTITLADGTPVTNGQLLTAAQLAGLQFDAPADLLASTSTSFTYSVFDGTVTVNAGTTISVTSVNDAPVASSSTITVAEESANTPLGLTAPTDIDGNALTITVTGLPSVGTITLADGTPVANGQALTSAQLAGLQFDAPADLLASTSTSFTYSVSDGTSTVNAGTTISVTPFNDAPVASSSTITVAEESANTPLGLTAPTDVDGNALTITVTGLPSVGTITLANGTPVTNGQALTATQLAGLQFDAPADLLASTSTGFSYTVSDGSVTVNAGTTITVTPVNDAPVASNSTITVAEESANTPLGLTAPTDVDGNPLTITVTGLPSIGTITLADGTPVTNGQVLTAAQLAGLQFDAPADLLASTSTSFIYSVSDGSVTVNAGTTISVTPINDAPAASSSTITVAEESANTPLGLTAPTDVDGNALTITVTGLPAVGTITLADGTPVSNGQVLTAAQLAGLQFDAPADLLASTSTSFTYSVSDGSATVNAGTTISVTPVNDAPVVSSSTITVAEESANTPLGLTAPTDADGNALTITITGLPAVGTITLADGTPVSNGQVLTAAQLAGLQFDAPADLLASTSTSFTYSVSDGSITVSAGTTISVTPINDAPAASSSTITVAEESANTPLGLTAPTDVDGNPLTITVTGLPAVGTITLADGTPVTNGQMLSAAQLAGLQFDAPADLLASTSTSFSYAVSDGTVTVNAGTTISVTPGNDAPVASSSTISVTEESVNTPLGLTAPTDVDGNPLTIAVTGLPTVGTVTLANGTPVTNGQVLGAAQLAGLQFNAPTDLLAATSTSFTYSVSDGTAIVNAGTTISVTPVNDAPVAQPTSITVGEDAAVVNGALIATDADAGAVLSFTLNGPAPAGLVVNANGTYSFDPANAAYQSLAVGQSQLITVPYTVTDNAGATSTANLVITVTGTNDAPVAQAAAFTVAEDAAIVAGTVTATDVDAGATRTFALNGAAPAGLTFNSSGSYSFDPSNAAYQSLGVGQSTVIAVPYTVTDDRGATSTANLVITVTGTNDAPVAVADSGALAENATLTATAATGVLANDTDVDSGDSRTVSAISFGATGGTVGTGLNGSYGTLTLNANGSYSYVANRPAAEALLAGQVVTESFTYTVRDAAGATSQATITFTITGAADAPTITGPLAGTVQEDTTLSTGGTLVITDPDASQSSFVAQSGTPGTHGSFSISAAGVWTYTLNNAAANVQALPAGSAPTESFVVTSADGTQRTITVNVNGLNDAPLAQAASFTVAEDAAVVTGTVTATDVDTGATLSYALNGAAPSGLTFNSNGSYSFNPANAAYQSLGVGQQQLITVPYTVTDDNGATSTANLVITVTGINDAPVANANSGPGTEDTVLTIVPATLLGNDGDVDSGDTLTITSVQDAVHGTVALSGGSIVFTPAANYSGPATFTYTVSDGRGGTSTATVTVNIAAVADAPTLVINGSSSTGGTTTPPSLPPSTGLVRDFFQDIGSVSSANAGNIATVEAAVESSTRTSTSVVTDISISDLNVDDAYRYTGFIYLAAGQTYEVGGSRDDTLAVKLGGNSVYGVGFNNWGSFTASAFTPSVSGYYSLEVIAYNGDGVGNLDINMSVNGAAAVDLNASNFRIYTNAGDFSSSPTVAGPMVPNGDGGYYPGGAGGSEDTAIRLGSISASLNDTDGSETLSLRIGSIPVGAVITDGTNSFSATAGNTSVVVTGWSLNNLSITPPLHYAGTINLSITATATESTGQTATTTGTLPVLVTAVTDAPVVAGDTTIVTVVQEDTAATVNFPILATRVDVDGSETLRVLVSGVPAGFSFSAGTDNGGGVWQFTAEQLDGLTLTLPANYNTPTTLTVTAVTRETSTGAEASDSSTITLLADSADGTSYTGTAAANTINGNNGDNFVNALGGNDTVSSGNGEDLVRGGDGDDSINSGAASDALWGDAGNDIILGGTGSDLVRGGAGDDTLTGGATAGAADGTADVFAWSLADAGSAGAPAVDTITDFNVGAVSAGGDVLDLRDLLSGDVLGAGNSAGNLANFLDFAVSGSGATASTTIRISSTGQFADGAYSAGATDQTIVLQGVDLPGALGLGSGATDTQIVQELLTRGKLIVDSAA